MVKNIAHFLKKISGNFTALDILSIKMRFSDFFPVEISGTHFIAISCFLIYTISVKSRHQSGQIYSVKFAANGFFKIGIIKDHLPPKPK